jgi:streptomycin 6-kinase
LRIPPRLQETIVGVHGERGTAWLDMLPETMRTCKQRWCVQLDAPFPNLTFHLVLSALRKDGTRVVLKLGVPSKEFSNEIRALHHFNGQAMVALLDYDEQIGCMVLEHLTPGTPLSKIDDDEEATHIFTEVVNSMKRTPPVQTDFPTLEQWATGFARLRSRFEGGTGPLPPGMVERAETLYQHLLQTTTDRILLHGDLHHDNILRNGAAWTAIDPKGVMGDPCFEAVAFLRNNWPKQGNPYDVLKKRIDTICRKLGYDKRRVIGFGFAHSVLSAWWNIEDAVGEWETDLRCAELFEHLMRETKS